MSSHFQPKVILITGCSSGFGLLMTARLAAKGHHVIATMRNLSKKDALVNELEKRNTSAEILPLDVTNPKSIADAINIIKAKYNRIDVLINNAGFGMAGFFEDLTENDIRDQMETNFFGVSNMCRAVIPIMRKQKEGRIINISSVAGFTANPCFGAYNASKWALEAFSESLYYELKQFGIKVLLIEPGTYRTQIFHENARHAKNFDNPESPYYPHSQRLRKMVIDYVERCRKDPEEIAQLAERLIESKNPAFRNIPDITNKMQYLFRKIIPFRIYSWILERILMKGT